MLNEYVAEEFTHNGYTAMIQEAETAVSWLEDLQESLQ